MMLTESLTRTVAASLHLWSLSPHATVHLLNRSENITFRVDEPDGRRLALRIHRPGYNSHAGIRSEIAWILALRMGSVIDTPAPLAGADGEFVQVLTGGPRCHHDGCHHDGSHHNEPDHNGPYHAVAFTFIPGREPASDADLPYWFGELGRITARLHRHARAWARPAWFTRRCWDAATMFGAAPVWGPWRAAAGLDAAGARVLAAGERLIGQRFAQFGRGSDRFGLIHADLRLTNLVVDESRLRVIDFDDCGFGWFAYDFAAAISFFEDSVAVPDLLAAWLAGYREVTALPAEQIAELPVFIFARRLLLTAWLASHPGAVAAGDDYTLGTVRMAERLLKR